MAAKNINMYKLGVLFCILSALVHLSDNQDNSTTTENTTMASTTSTASTTTTTTVTTTTIAPTIPGTTIPPNTDISKCPCDLTGNACDVNCCCDPECSAADKLVFSECLPSSYTLDDKLCFNKDVFLFENGPAASGDSNGLFCIYFDNEAERNYYTNPTLVTSETEFLRYADQYGKFSFQDTAPPPTLTSQFNNYYRSGDPIYVVFQNQAFSYLSLPASQTSSTLCIDSNPAGYLLEQTNQCSRTFTNLSTECLSDPALKADTFYKGFRIVKDPFLLKAFNSSTSVKDPIVGSPNLTDVTDLYNNNFTLEFEPIECIQNGFKAPCNSTTQLPVAAPTYNGSVCSQAIVEVHYRFETNGIYGVEKAYVTFVYSDITTNSVTQKFSTSFSKASSAATQPVARSGNPGYQIGQPITAGVFNRTVTGATTDERILLTQYRGQQLALVRPSVSGDCLTDAGQLREPVLFGQDMRTGCFIQVTSTSDISNCQLLQQSIFTAIEGYAVPTFDPAFNVYPKNSRYVATFGDSDIKKTGDWVEILYQNRPPPQTASSQCFLSLGANLHILYANIGALPNPQPKIIGVAYVYDAPQTVSYKCSGPYCQPGASGLSQKVEISSSVTFIDVSQSPQAVEGKYPTFAVRLPYDFFYPFLNSAPKWHGPSAMPWLVIAAVSGHILFH
ncbi:unnamed protein product [Lymnaea stagnalis]|uniref:Tectonic domain-containing protein n=1 Tax=Lymnaea stagnalis TaxID=6523 RepID=A0AAV2IS68_LYMST